MAREQELEALIVAESLGRTVLRLKKVYCQSNPVLTALPTSSSMQVDGVETWPTAAAPVSEKPLRKQTTTEREAVSDGHVSLSRLMKRHHRM